MLCDFIGEINRFGYLNKEMSNSFSLSEFTEHYLLRSGLVGLQISTQ